MFDFHCHALANMDDGASDLKTSLNILNTLENQGVDVVALTSHFYPDYDDIDEYLDRRNKAFDELIENYRGKLKLLKGAEVYYYHGIANSDEIEKLCLENTNLLLLELPFSRKIDINEIVVLNNKLQVVLAHIERYLNIYSKKEIELLLDRNIYLQVNAESFSNKYFKYIRGLFENQNIKFVGSDAHNLTDRKPVFDEAFNFIENEYGEEVLNDFKFETERILKEIDL